MKTEVAIDGTSFLINNTPTCKGISHRGHSIEGLLFNSRMVQAIFDDECPETCVRWNYPDTGVWDADRNTSEFCAMLPEYRRHGLLAVTVGLQGGGSIYEKGVYDSYLNSAFTPDGALKKAYFDRLARVLKAADEAGMVVIVNYFYFKQAARFVSEQAACKSAERATEWLLNTGYRNVLVDVANESSGFWHYPALEPGNIHKAIELVRSVTVNGRRLLVGNSAAGGMQIPEEKWFALEDFSMPHGNGLRPAELKAYLRKLKALPGYTKRPRPLLVNEDSIILDNLESAVEEHASWGYYSQGYGSGYRDLTDWTVHGREDRFEELSGYQTVPVNWGINTDEKRAFFARLQAITGGAWQSA